MATMTEKTIVLKGHDKGHHDEYVSGGAITPGMVIEMQPNGTVLQMVAALALAMKKGLMIAKEDALQGKKITDAYASGDLVFTYNPVPGDHIGAFVKSGANLAVGDLVVPESGGSGLWVEAAGTETRMTAEVLESTGGALAANGHVKVKVIAV